MTNKLYENAYHVNWSRWCKI